MNDALKKAVDENKEFLFIGNDEPVCPHCCARYDTTTGPGWDVRARGRHKICCKQCKAIYVVFTHCHPTYDTHIQPRAPQ